MSSDKKIVMGGKSRSKYAIINVVSSVGFQLFSVLCTFIMRTVFIKTLGASYLGINGLFTNILSLLSLAELGIGSAITFSMYKPIHDNDQEKVKQLINYYKVLYRYIGIIVLVIGLLIIPFLDKFINLDENIGNVTFYYLLYLGNAVISYFYTYRTSILIADQKDYLNKIYNIIFTIIRTVLQFIALLEFKSFTIYILVQIVTSAGVNIFASIRATKHYPFIKEKAVLPKEERKIIWSDIKSMFFYKIGNVVLNSTDSIIISALISTYVVGLYSNYATIITSISTFTGLIFTSVQASMGNLNAENNQQKQFFIFKVLNVLSFWLFGFCSICMCVMFQDFVTIWVGNDFLLDDSVMYVCVLNFYLAGVLYPILNFRTTIGLFKQTKYVMLYASVINIILSLVLGKYFGLIGVFLATGISRLSTNMWYEPYKLFKIYFKQPVYKYYISRLLELVYIVLIIVIIQYVFSILNIENLYLRFILKTIVSIVFSNVFIVATLLKREEFKYLFNTAKRLVIRKS